MAGNRTELILSLINKAIIDVEKGMEQSCGFVQDSLLMRINDLKNRQERTATESYDINLDDLRRKTTPLLEDVDVELTHKKRYAILVELNIKAHYGYACVALSKLINSIKEVIVDNYHDTDKPVIAFRPHALGGIRPPDPSAVISCVEQKFKSLNLLDCLDSATVAAAFESITTESDNFHRENAINNAIDISAVEEDPEPISRVVTLSVGEIRNALILNGRDIVINGLVSQRPAQDGVEWRPDAKWRYPFENLWGDNKITIKTISTLLAKTIIPNVELSNFLLYMCNHIRAVIKSVKAILFSRSEASVYFQDETLSEWCAWMDLYNALEWFMLVARYIIYIYGKKETFLNSDATTNLESGEWCLLVAAVESIPPNLMSEDWVKQNLFSWPDNNNNNNTKTQNVTEETILSMALRTGPGATHPVFGNKNDGEIAVTNRITVDSATFCVKVLLGRALAEEAAGTKMLVEARGDGGGIRSDVVIPLGVLPTEELTKNATNNFCSTVATASPFIASPTYLLRKIWNVESLEAAARRENNTIASAVLSNVEPLMFFDGGMTDPGKEWACLKMLGCCQAPTTIRDVWLPVLGNVDVDTILAVSKTMAERICKKEIQRDKLKQKASAAISSFLSGAISDINEANHSSSLATVNALWSTLVWKAVSSEVLSRLSSFPDQK